MLGVKWMFAVQHQILLFSESDKKIGREISQGTSQLRTFQTPKLRLQFVAGLLHASSPRSDFMKIEQ
jgi:hypothetical protein